MRWLPLFNLILFSLVGVSVGCQSAQRPGSDGKGLFGLGLGNESRQDMDELMDPLGERNVNRLITQDLAPSQIGTTLQSRFSKTDPEVARQFFNEAEGLYRSAIRAMETQPQAKEHEALFQKAARRFQLAGSRFPESSIEEDSLFYEGEAWFFANRYVQANRAYEKLLSLYSGTRYLDKVERNRFAIAEYWLETADTSGSMKIGDARFPGFSLRGEARRILHRIRIDDPTGKLADDATMALGMAHFKSENWYEAAETFEDLRRNYPGSQHQFFAHLYELKSRLKSYRGSSYDAAPLVAADELLKAIVTRFPEQAGAEKEFLAVEATRIRNLLADRDLEMARFFENKGENRAARFYYRQVAENYGDTQIASEVGQMIAALEDKPDEPTPPGEWLADWLPERKDEKPLINASLQERLLR